MRKKEFLPGGELEYRVLAALWRAGSATGRELHERVSAPGGLAYTTTAKVLERLQAKGLVARERAGRAFLYRAGAKQERVARALVRRLVRRMFGPEPRPAMSTLVDAVEEIDPELVEELSRAIAARRRSKSGS